MNWVIGKLLSVSYHYKNSNEISTYYCFSFDKLTMYDGASMTSPMIGEYCDSTPPDIITTSNEIFVHFETSPIYTSPTYIGFKMMYSPTGNQH